MARLPTGKRHERGSADCNSAEDARPFAGLRVAYLVNTYPKVSHTFIRREILALERLGTHIERVALRGWDGVLIDASDVAERDRTRYPLQEGALPLLGALMRVGFAGPADFSPPCARPWSWGVTR